jgi:exosortase N
MLALACFIAFHFHYFLFSFQIILGLLVLPFLVKPNKTQTGNWRYAVFSGCFLLLGLISNLQVFVFLSWGCLLFFIIEWYWGALGYLPLFFLGCIAPALYYVVNIFSFPLRLQLSAVACQLYSYAGILVENKGSYFLLPNGSSFHIDEGCVGLKMFGTGLIAAVLLLAIKEKQSAKPFSFFAIAWSMFVMLVLLVLCNFMRILVLVLFRSMPNTASHEILGIVSLLVYAVLPFYFFIKILPQQSDQKQSFFSANQQSMKHLVPIVFLVVFFCSTFYFSSVRTENKRDIALEKLVMPGYTKTPKEDGVMEFKSDSLLIYIKPAIKAYEGGHPPQICWRASGFELENFSERKFENYSYMFGVLKKGPYIQYTAWWYDNGNIKTIHEWEWRRRNESPFRVINLNALDSIFLVQSVERIINHSPLKN